MSAAAPQIRPAVHRCMTLAARSAVAGDHTRARSFFTLALDLATPEESTTVLRAADRLLGGLTPEAAVAPPQAAVHATGETAGGIQAQPGIGAPLEVADIEPAQAPAPPVAAPKPPPSAARTVRSAAVEPRTSAPRPAPRPRRTAVSARGFAAPLFGALVVGALIWGGLSVLAPDPVDVRKIEAAIEGGRAGAALQELEGVESTDARISLLRGRALLASGDTAAARKALATAAASASEEGENGEAGARAKRILERLDG